MFSEYSYLYPYLYSYSYSYSCMFKVIVLVLKDICIVITPSLYYTIPSLKSQNITFSVAGPDCAGHGGLHPAEPSLASVLQQPSQLSSSRLQLALACSTCRFRCCSSGVHSWTSLVSPCSSLSSCRERQQSLVCVCFLPVFPVKCSTFCSTYCSNYCSTYSSTYCSSYCSIYSSTTMCSEFLARIVTRSPCFICSMQLLKSLHCLPVCMISYYF